jgi:hypothetical protein
MAARTDSQIGVQATVFASRDAVVEACTRAANVLGNHASASSSAAKVTVKILPGMIKSMSKVSPTVGIDLSPGSAEGSIDVNAHIESYRTSQSALLGFIPIGPKLLVGKSTYLNFLTSLEQELAAIDTGKGTIRRTSPTR